MQVFKNRERSLRGFVERSRDFGDAEYVIFGDRRISYRRAFARGRLGGEGAPRALRRAQG